MKYIFCFLIILATTLNSFCQKQGNIWYFGDHAGLDFSSGAPVYIGNGQTYYVGCGGCHNEGTATLCDSAGGLLMYCNGEKIWDRNQQVMPNGDTLLGGVSSTQSSIILPLPGSSRFFYVFTTDDFFLHNLQNGLRYSVVDMCLNNGYGDVVIGQKNILLHVPVAEKLTAVKHGNGTDYWVISHGYYSDAFYAYHLTPTGITDSVISHVGSVHPTGLQNLGGAIGQMKASPDGSKLAVVNGNSSDNIAEYFDFNKFTGVVSNWVNIQSNLVYNYYGVSFSPDNSKLYIAGILNNNAIFQFDLNAGGGNPDSVRASEVSVTPGYNYNFEALQLANNGKIYVTHTPLIGNPYVSVINNPNAKGILCVYADNVISLNGQGASYGLPNFVDSYDYDNTTTNCNVGAIFIAPHFLCPGTCTAFINASVNATNYQWFFPGASPDTSTMENPVNICYSTPGNYSVSLIASSFLGSDTLSLSNFITVYPQPFPQAISQSGDTLFAIAGANSYQWYDSGNLISGATNDFYIAPSSGDYSVVATDANGCEAEAAVFNVVAGIHSEELAKGNWQLAISPNPVEDKLIIKNEKLIIGTADIISIYNVLGAMVLAVHLPIAGCQLPTCSIDVSELPTGLYTIEISSASNVFRGKFVKR